MICIKLTMFLLSLSFGHCARKKTVRGKAITDEVIVCALGRPCYLSVDNTKVRAMEVFISKSLCKSTVSKNDLLTQVNDTGRSTHIKLEWDVPAHLNIKENNVVYICGTQQKNKLNDSTLMGEIHLYDTAKLKFDIYIERDNVLRVDLYGFNALGFKIAVLDALSQISFDLIPSYDIRKDRNAHYSHIDLDHLFQSSEWLHLMVYLVPPPPAAGYILLDTATFYDRRRIKYHMYKVNDAYASLLLSGVAFTENQTTTYRVAGILNKQSTSPTPARKTPKGPKTEKDITMNHQYRTVQFTTKNSFTVKSYETVHGYSYPFLNSPSLWQYSNVKSIGYSDGGIKFHIFAIPLEIYKRGLQIYMNAAGTNYDGAPTRNVLIYQSDPHDHDFLNYDLKLSPIGTLDVKIEAVVHPLSVLRISYLPDPKVKNNRPNEIGKDKVPDYNHTFDASDLYIKAFDGYLENAKRIHTSIFLPGKSYTYKDRTVWTINDLLIPGLFKKFSARYSIALCDRWRHPFCLYPNEFDLDLSTLEPHPSKVSEITPLYNEGEFSLTVSTYNTSESGIRIKLVEAKYVQYARLTELCDTRSGIHGKFKDKEELVDKNGATYHNYKFDMPDIIQGNNYYVCISLLSNDTIEPGRLSKKLLECAKRKLEESTLDTYHLVPHWDFLAILNTQAILGQQRCTILNKKSSSSQIYIGSTGNFDIMKFAGIYLTDNLNLKCSEIVPTGGDIDLTKDKTTHREIKPPLLIEAADLTENKPSAGPRTTTGFWIDRKFDTWSTFGKYIRFSGPLELRKKMYKMCTCTNNVCFDGGNIVKSDILYFDLKQLFSEDVIFDGIKLNKSLCLYNESTLKCFNAEGDLTKVLETQYDIALPTKSFKYIMFDQSTDLLAIVTESKIYLYNDDFTKHVNVVGLSETEDIFSFSDATFALNKNGSVHVYLSDSTLYNAIYSSNYEENKDTIFESKNAIEFKTLTGEEDTPLKALITFEGIIGKINGLSIVRSSLGDGIFHTFFMDDSLTLHYHTVKIPNSTDANLVTTFKSKIDLNSHFDVKQRITFKAKNFVRGMRDYLILFICDYGDDVMKSFYLDTDELKFYSNVITSDNIVDFVVTETHIFALNAHISTDNEVSQYITQHEHTDVLDIKFHYPSLSTHVSNEVIQSFVPTVEYGVLTRYYTDEVKLTNIGFNLDENTGAISGKASFRGNVSFTVYAEGLLGKSSLVINLYSDCPPGKEYSSVSKNCLDCPIGYYKDVASSERCLTCDRIVPGSTTVSTSSTTFLQCVCKPGSYMAENKCVPCPSGTFTTEYGSLECTGTCPNNESSGVVGASSLAELQCKCDKGYYRREGICVECEIGYYCPGDDAKPIRCKRHMTTLNAGMVSSKDCVCDLGYEWVNGKCHPCNAFSYKDTPGNTRCTLCSNPEDEIQLHTSKFGATSKNDCNVCRPGYYSDPNSKACVLCPPNSFCPGLNAEPILCGENTVLSTSLATKATDCLCSKGYGIISMNRNVNNKPSRCAPCPINTFQYIDGSKTQCIPCPEHSYTMGERSISISDCLPAPSYYNVSGADFSAFANDLEIIYDSSTDRSAYALCNSGIKLQQGSYNVVLQPSLQSCVDLCKSIVYCRYAYFMTYSGGSLYREFKTLLDKNQHTDYSPCMLFMVYEKLSVPTITSQSFMPSKIKSPPGHNTLCEIIRPKINDKLSMISMVRCPRNYYCPGDYNYDKIRCPANSTTLFVGATSVDNCMCMPGFEPPLSSQFKICAPCNKGYYKSTISNSRCVPCPQNMTTIDTGSTNIDQCICNPNLYASKTDMVLETLKIDSYFPSKIASPLNDFITKNFHVTEAAIEVNTKLSYTCKYCPIGHYCSGLWLTMDLSSIHAPPASCPPGSTVPTSSTNISSLSSCLCFPGYGLNARNDNLIQICEKCPAGTFRDTFENASCPESCGLYSTSLPGATSQKDCFCLPGLFMTRKESAGGYGLACTKCMEGAVCPGGFRNQRKQLNQDGDDNLFDHTSPVPRMGYVAIYKYKGSARWSPNESDYYISDSPTLDTYKLYEEVPDIHPCVYPSRCIKNERGYCSEGSTGYLCSSCEEGYDITYFRSRCKRCHTFARELVLLIIPRLSFVFVVFVVYYISKLANTCGEFSLITIFKIWYMFSLSLLPLGLQPLTSTSSLKSFYRLYRLLFYVPITGFVYVERLGCWEEQTRKVLSFFNGFGIFDTREKLGYTQIWYLQKFLGLLKPLIDIVILCIFYGIFKIASNIFSKTSKLCINLKDKESILTEQYGDELTLNRIYSQVASDRNIINEKSMNIHKYRFHALIQQIAIALFLSFPGFFVSSLSMFWCRTVRYKGEDEISVLLHLPSQVCNVSDKLYRAGFVLSRFSFMIILISLFITLFVLYEREYDVNSWKSVLMTGYNADCRWWDIVQLSRQFFIILLVMVQQHINPSGDSEQIRLLYYTGIHALYLSLHLQFSPYDYRSNNTFHHLETKLLIVNVFTGLFMYGCHSYDLSDFAGLPIIVALYSYCTILWSLFIEFGNITYMTSRHKENKTYFEFIIPYLPSLFDYINTKVYFDYKHDTIVLEGLPSKEFKDNKHTRFGNFGIFKKSILSDVTFRLFKYKSASYSMDKRAFLIFAIKDIIERTTTFRDGLLLSNTSFYFVIRFTFWYCHCIHINADGALTEKKYIHWVIFHYFLNQDHATKLTTSRVLANFPLSKLSSHSSVYHGGMACFGNCNVFRERSILEQINEVAESLLVDCLFDNFYDDNPISLTELYYALLSMDHIDRESICRMFSIFERHTEFLRDNKRYMDTFNMDTINNEIIELKESVKNMGEIGEVILRKHELSNRIDEINAEIGALKRDIERKTQIIMVARVASSITSSLNAGIDNLLSNEFSHDQILSTITKINEGPETAADPQTRQRRQGILLPTLKLNK